MTNQQRVRLLIVYTGGTIGMIENPVTHALQPFDFSHLIDNVPKVKMLGYDIDNIQFDPPIDSSNMSPQHWSEIARAIEQHYDDYDGFVVLHGTDTMAFTASALSFMLENLHKPVIITGSQLPIGEVRTDGEENLITALQVAAATDSLGQPMVQEVAILFNDSLCRGNRSTKTSADDFDAFKSFNYPPLARIGLNVTFNTERLLRTPADAPLRVTTEMDRNVMPIDIYPGITETILSHQLHTPGIKGVVLKTFGAGNAPTEPWFIALIADAVARGIVVLNVTQCADGGVDDSLYETGNTLSAAGVVSGHDITREAAITKLMYLFGQRLDAQAVKQQLARSLRGEITTN